MTQSVQLIVASDGVYTVGEGVTVTGPEYCTSLNILLMVCIFLSLASNSVVLSHQFCYKPVSICHVHSLILTFSNK